MSGFSAYSNLLSATLSAFDWAPVQKLTTDLHALWLSGGRVFICGNGGSAANAVHIANDLIYPIARWGGPGIRACALSANQAVLTCLGNDLGYDQVFAAQLKTQGSAGDLLLALSGSGNSANILRAIETARELGMKSHAILGFDGGKAKHIADVAIHFPVHDMQVAEDTQTIVGHMVMKELARLGRAPKSE